MLKGRILVAQGGGPTSVINESVAGVVVESRKLNTVSQVYGAFHGIRGIINEDFGDLTQETSHNLESIAKTPSSILGSTRDKPDIKYCREISKVLLAHDISAFFYIGGNDSADTLRIIEHESMKMNHPIRCMHIPKTIDNDIVMNDHTPGYPSASRYIANWFTGVNLDNMALPGIHIAVVMGRNSGFLTAASALGRAHVDDGPHLIYLPERPFYMEKFEHDVKKVYEKYGRCIVAVSEGIKDENGKFIAEKLGKLTTDQHGNVELSKMSISLVVLLAKYIEEKIGGNVRIRSDNIGFVQRVYPESISDVDRREAREVGEKAVQYVQWQDINGSVVIKRTGFYSVDYGVAKLKDIGGKTKIMPNEFISKENNDVTDKFVMYLRPLLGRNMPEIFRVRARKIPKILNK